MRLHTVGLVMILALAHSICVVPLAVEAQPPAEVWRLGFLSGEPPTESLPVVVPFFERLRALGYVEGQNLTIERRWAEPREHRLPDLAAELVQLRVNCIVAVTWAAVQAAKQATTTIPIVMIINSDPVEGGLVASLARPGGNITGVQPHDPRVSRETAGTAPGGRATAHPRGCPLGTRGASQGHRVQQDAGCRSSVGDPSTLPGGAES